MTTTIEDLLDKSDFELCNSVFSRLQDAADGVGASPSYEEECVVVLTWGTAGVIGNGGFRFLFEGASIQDDPGFAKTTAAFATLGLDDVARAFEEALAWFPGSQPPNDPSERAKLMKAVSADDEERVSELVWRSKERHVTQLAGYIRLRKAAIDAILADYDRRRVGAASPPVVVVAQTPATIVRSSEAPAPSDRPPPVIPQRNLAIVIGCAIALLALAIAVRPPHPKATARLIGTSSEGLLIELSANRSLEVDAIGLPRGLAEELHATLPEDAKEDVGRDVPVGTVRWVLDPPFKIGTTRKQLELPCQPKSTARGPITFRVRNVDEPLVLVLGDGNASGR